MANNTSFQQSWGSAMGISPTQARNYNSFPSAPAIVYGCIPLFGYGTFTAGNYWANRTYDDVWPNVYQKMVEVYTDSGGTLTITSIWGQKSDNLGPTATTSGSAYQPNGSGMASYTNSGTVFSGTYTDAGGGSGTYTATLSQQWQGQASLSALWSNLTIAANNLLNFLGVGCATTYNATVVNGGTGYTVGDVLTLSGGTLIPADVGTQPGTSVNGAAGKYTVSTVGSGGKITAVTLNVNGLYAAQPAIFPNTPTGGTGSNCTLNISTYPGIYFVGGQMLITNQVAAPGHTGWACAGYLGGGVNAFMCAGRGVPMRISSGRPYINQASIIETPSPFSASSVSANCGYCVSAQSSWLIRKPSNAITYLEPITISGGSFVFGTVTQNDGPWLWPCTPSWTPATIAATTSYGIIGFRPAAV